MGKNHVVSFVTTCPRGSTRPKLRVGGGMPKPSFIGCRHVCRSTRRRCAWPCHTKYRRCVSEWYWLSTPSHARGPGSADGPARGRGYCGTKPGRQDGTSVQRPYGLFSLCFGTKPAGWSGGSDRRNACERQRNQPVAGQVSSALINWTGFGRTWLLRAYTLFRRRVSWGLDCENPVPSGGFGGIHKLISLPPKAPLRLGTHQKFYP